MCRAQHSIGSMCAHTASEKRYSCIALSLRLCPLASISHHHTWLLLVSFFIQWRSYCKLSEHPSIREILFARHLGPWQIHSETRGRRVKGSQLSRLRSASASPFVHYSIPLRYHYRKNRVLQSPRSFHEEVVHASSLSLLFLRGACQTFRCWAV